MPTLIYGTEQRNQLDKPSAYYPNMKTYISCSKLIDAIMDYNRSKKIVMERDRFTYSKDGRKMTIRLKHGLR